MGIRFRSYFSTEEMMTLLRDCGFAATHALTLDEARAQYFVGRTDGLDVDTVERLIWARVNDTVNDNLRAAAGVSPPPPK
jgi:hypothetical protein